MVCDNIEILVGLNYNFFLCRLSHHFCSKKQDLQNGKIFQSSYAKLVSASSIFNKDGVIVGNIDIVHSQIYHLVQLVAPTAAA